MFLKFFLFFLGGIYLLRLLSPFLFKLMFSSLANKAQSSEPQKKPKKKKASDTLGEYIDYEEVE